MKRRTYEILFGVREADRTAALFSVFILTLIALNVLAGILETDQGLRVEINRLFGFGAPATESARSFGFFFWFEVISVLIFTVEYALRLWSATADPRYAGAIRGRWRMARRPLLIIDLIAILPFYLQALFPGLDLRFVRALRLFRLFRLFRSAMLARSVDLLLRVIKARKDELIISFFVVLIAVILSASVMYLVEKPYNDDFHSVPQSMWWAVVTITTVGYGDMHPITATGQFIGAIIAFLGVCIFALPVGIIGAGFIEEIDEQKKERARIDAADDPNGNEEEAVSGWLSRGRERVRSYADRLIEDKTSSYRAQAIKLALLEGTSRAVLMERYGSGFSANALAETEMAEGFVDWLVEQTKRDRDELGRMLAMSQEPAPARETLASGLATLLEPSLTAVEQRRARLTLLTAIGSIGDPVDQEV